MVSSDAERSHGLRPQLLRAEIDHAVMTPTPRGEAEVVNGAVVGVHLAVRDDGDDLRPRQLELRVLGEPLEAPLDVLYVHDASAGGVRPAEFVDEERGDAILRRQRLVLQLLVPRPVHEHPERHRDELIVFDAPVVVDVRLAEQHVDLFAAQPEIRAVQRPLELLRVERPVAVVVELREQLLHP